MDSDDERASALDNSFKSLAFFRLESRNHLELRVFERQEAALHRLRASPFRDHNVARCRLFRFFRAMEGFHHGSLDLSGRHARRYHSLHQRFWALVNEIIETLEDGELGLEFSDDEREDLIQHCLTGWGVGGGMTGHELLQNIAMALETIDLNPTPRIQTLCLLDLPPEILHIIVGRYDNHNARRLGSTCRCLHTISRSYIYKECMIALSTQWINSKKFGGLEASNMLSVFDDGLLRAQEALIENTRFLQSHPDIQKSVTNLTIIDRWDIDARNFSSVHADTHKHSAFYSPIYKAVYDLIPHFVSLKVLVLSQWYLSKELLNGLRYLSHLHTIEVASCVSVIHTLMHPPQLNSVRTLVFHFIDEVEVDSWVVLSMCPDVENLTVSTPKETKSWQLTPAIPRSWRSLNPLKTLRNYSLSHIASTFVPVITLWLLNASRSLSNQHLPLTHLKIELEDDDDLPGPMMFNLLDGLAGTSLESLVLIGIQYTEPDIFDRIGRALPNLQELTLCCGRRVNYDREYLKRWSRPAWEYPSHFLSFRKLHYLSWNIAHPDISYFSRTMLYFEQDQFPGLDSWDFGEDSWDEGEIVAKSIRAYSPSLRCMVLPSSLSRDTYRCVEVNGELSFAAEGFRMRLMQS